MSALSPMQHKHPNEQVRPKETSGKAEVVVGESCTFAFVGSHLEGFVNTA